MKNLLRSLTRPIFLAVNQAFRGFKTKTFEAAYSFSGEFKTWNEAVMESKGYSMENILIKTKEAVLEVKDGKAVYERDSVVFDKIDYSWHILAFLFRISVENGNVLNLIDFGGSLGSTYFQCRNFLKSLNKIQWMVVEQPNYVECGKKYFEDGSLKFSNNLEICLKDQEANVIIASGVIQYVEFPFEIVDKIINSTIEYVIIDRTGFQTSEFDMITVQNVKDEIYEASYPVRFFSYGKFRAQFEDEFELLAEADSSFELPLFINGVNCFWKALIYKRIKN